MRKMEELENEQNMEAFPMMYETVDGELNKYPEITAMKPAQLRQENEIHPSEVLDINDDFNFYRYSWMADSE